MLMPIVKTLENTQDFVARMIVLIVLRNRQERIQNLPSLDSARESFQTKLNRKIISKWGKE